MACFRHLFDQMQVSLFANINYKTGRFDKSTLQNWGFIFARRFYCVKYSLRYACYCMFIHFMKN